MSGESAMNWSVSDSSGSETILVIAAKERLEFVERTIARLPRPSADAAPDDLAIGPGGAEVRGIHKLVPVAVDPGVIDRLISGAGLQDGQAGVWVWRVTLKNKGA